MYTSDILPDAASPGAALIVLLTTLGAVRPSVVFEPAYDWRHALADLRAVGIRIEENPDGSVALVDTAPEPGRLTEAERVRKLVRQSPSWVRAVTATARWSAIRQRLATARASPAAVASASRPAYQTPFGMRGASEFP